MPIKPMAITIRAYDAQADEDRAVEFWAEVAQRDADIQPPSRAGWRAYVGRSSNRDGRDFAWAEDGGESVALLMSAREWDVPGEPRNFRIVVDPTRRRQGVATRLLRYVEEQDAGADVLLQASCRRSWEAGTQFLTHHGFHAVLEDLWMVADTDPNPGPVPSGIRLRAYVPGPSDDAAWVRLNAEGYEGGPEFTSISPEDIELMRSEDGFGLTFAQSEDSSVGFCHVDQYAGKHYINSLVVSPTQRGSGIGRALLRDAIAQLHRAGERRVRLTVFAHNAPALALYQSIGFAVEDVSSVYQKERGS